MSSLPTPPQDVKITLHYLTASRSHRILFLLEDLNIPYTLITYPRTANRTAPPELKGVHPLGKSPVLEVEAAGGKKIVLAESAMMLEYLCEYYGAGKVEVPERFDDEEAEEKSEGGKGNVGGMGIGRIGREREEWVRYKYFMNYAEGSLMPFLVMKLVIGSIEGPSTPFLLRPLSRLIANGIYTAFLHPNLTTHFNFLEAQLACSPNNGLYFCGDKITAVDFLMIFPVEAAKGRVPGFTQEAYPRLWGWCERVKGREGWGRSVRVVEERCGKFEETL